MPQWVVLLALAIAAWLLVAVGGGLLVGRALRGLSRLRRRKGRRPPSSGRPPGGRIIGS